MCKRGCDEDDSQSNNYQKISIQQQTILIVNVKLIC